MKKTGFLGGSFDPIHFGHINLAISLMEKAQLDEVVFCPAFVSPHKTAKPPVATASQRLTMVQYAIEGISGFSMTDMELQRKNISFTVDSIKQLKESKADIYLLLSENTYSSFFTWKEYRKILQMAHPLIGCMNKSKIHVKEPFTLENFIEVPCMDISSTQIRQRLKERLYCGHLVLPKVLDFICQNEIYY